MLLDQFVDGAANSERPQRPTSEKKRVRKADAADCSSRSQDAEGANEGEDESHGKVFWESSQRRQARAQSHSQPQSSFQAHAQAMSASSSSSQAACGTMAYDASSYQSMDDFSFSFESEF